MGPERRMVSPNADAAAPSQPNLSKFPELGNPQGRRMVRPNWFPSTGPTSQPNLSKFPELGNPQGRRVMCPNPFAPTATPNLSVLPKPGNPQERIWSELSCTRDYDEGAKK